MLLFSLIMYIIDRNIIFFCGELTFMDRIARFFEDLQHKAVAFIGVGVTNNDIIRLFLKKGISVTVCDKKSSDELGALYYELLELGCRFSLGEGYLDAIYKADVIFRAPGFYFLKEELTKARNMGIVVTSEMEVFLQLCPCKTYGVSGSDGKTTTTTLISELLTAAGKTVHKGGNIGRALLPIIEQIKDTDVAVIELSSFQLISMRQSPDVAVITNISPNHLDVHGTMEEYVDCKKNLIAHQGAFTKTVLNADNAKAAALSPLARGKLETFSRLTTPNCGAFMMGDTLCYNDYGTVTEIISAGEIRIPGTHNVENFLAAITAVWGEVSLDNIKRIAREFGGVEHRIEFIREKDGIKWYNDSIATSPTRMIAGLGAFNQRLIVIAGGYDKKIPFEPISRPICEKVKLLILLGATADRIEQVVRADSCFDESLTKIVRAKSLEEAVSIALAGAVKGDIITLSPACASFDLYPNFEARGEHFKRLVNKL